MKKGELYQKITKLEAEIENLKNNQLTKGLVEYYIDFGRERERSKSLTSDKIFHDHIKGHFEKEHPDWKVYCKICGKTYDETVEAFRRKGVKLKEGE